MHKISPGGNDRTDKTRYRCHFVCSLRVSIEHHECSLTRLPSRGFPGNVFRRPGYYFVVVSLGNIRAFLTGRVNHAHSRDEHMAVNEIFHWGDLSAVARFTHHVPRFLRTQIRVTLSSLTTISVLRTKSYVTEVSADTGNTETSHDARGKRSPRNIFTISSSIGPLGVQSPPSYFLRRKQSKCSIRE